MKVDNRLSGFETTFGGGAGFHIDVEILTASGWKRVSELAGSESLAQFWPESGRVEFALPIALTTRTTSNLYRVSNEGIDIRIAGDHRMLGYRSRGYATVCRPDKMNQVLRGIWNAGEKREGLRLGSLTEDDIRRAVCIQADGSVNHNRVRFGFKKKRKIARFASLFGIEHPAGGMTCDDIFSESVPWQRSWETILSKAKVWNVGNLMRLPQSYLKTFMDELCHWDSHTRKGGKSFNYSTAIQENADTVQAIAAITGYKSSLVECPSDRPNRSTIFNVRVKLRNHTRAGTFRADNIPGSHAVYCLSMPSSFVIARDGGKVVVIG